MDRSALTPRCLLLLLAELLTPGVGAVKNGYFLQFHCESLCNCVMGGMALVGSQKA